MTNCWILDIILITLNGLRGTIILSYLVKCYLANY